MRFKAALTIFLLSGAIGPFICPAAAQDQRNDATTATKAANDKLLTDLPFSDHTDFDNAHKGFIAPLPSELIKGNAGNTIWNPTQYDFIKEGMKSHDTVKSQSLAQRPTHQHQRPV
jgi:alkyl sulfatase BDS1-like metallo-beta-lactamase superfamily hydrolase